MSVPSESWASVLPKLESSFACSTGAASSASARSASDKRWRQRYHDGRPAKRPSSKWASPSQRSRYNAVTLCEQLSRLLIAMRQSDAMSAKNCYSRRASSASMPPMRYRMFIIRLSTQRIPLMNSQPTVEELKRELAEARNHQA